MKPPLSEKKEIEYRPFDPASASLQEYDDQAYQNIYYVAESFEDAKTKFRHWVREQLSRHFSVREGLKKIKQMQVSWTGNHKNTTIQKNWEKKTKKKDFFRN